MSREPVSRSVFWRRRLVLLTLILLTVVLVIEVLGRVAGGDEPAPTPEPTVTATPANEADETGNDTTDKTTENPSDSTAGPSSEKVSVSLTTTADACAPENLRIQPFVPEGQIAGGAVDVEFLVSSLNGAACTFTPDAKDLLLVIEANKQAIYDSTVCKETLLDSPVLVAAGYSTLVRTTWNGRGSGRACSPKEGFAPGGKYRLRVGTLGGEPGTVKFNLGAAPKPVKTKATKSKKDEKKSDDKKKPDKKRAKGDD